MAEENRSAEMIPLSSPDITDTERRHVLDVLSGRALSLGPMLPAFEAELAKAAGTRYAVAVNSGTSALHLCVKAAGIGEGDEVITTPFSFVASANCLLYERAIPRFVDIDINTYNIDTTKIGAAVTPRTRAVLPVHVFGMPCDMPAIKKLAATHGLSIIEDACEAIGASIAGQNVGSFGQTGAFAFYPNKQITTGEGGAVVTNDLSIARLCRSWRNQGRGENGAWLLHERLGYNYRLSDINCALGLAQLSRLQEILALRKQVADNYYWALRDIAEIIPPPSPLAGCQLSWFVYVVRLAPEFSREDRARILGSLRNAGIECNSYFAPIHLQSFYREKFGFKPGDFPVTEHVAERTIALPFFNRLSEKQVASVVSGLWEAIAHLRHRSRVAVF